MSAKVKALIFDLDGTLVDTLGDIAGSVNHALVRHGHAAHSVEEIKGFIGEGVENLIRRALPPQAEHEVADVITTYRAHYAEHLFDSSAPYPGITELLRALRSRGLPLGVLSNKPDSPTRKLVAGLFGETFQETRGERSGTPRKPDPTSAIEVAKALGVDPRECAFVGDTAIDMRTAVNAGMVPVGVKWGFRAEELLPIGARFVVGQPSELLALVGRFAAPGLSRGTKVTG
ncbi:MAG: HAD family hydrolase [Myxococcaceae bacterium]